MTENKTCRVCGVKLNEENWYPSQRKRNTHVCKECHRAAARAWRKANPGREKEQRTRARRKQGRLPFNENKECASYLGVHIAERVLSHVFKDVQVMPMNNPGYDIICNQNKLIDIKSACQQNDGRWEFRIRRNTTADFFLCLAFDNREDLTPLHAWLIPGSVVNHLVSATIRQSMIHKWDKYRKDISKIRDCCDTIKNR